VPSASPLKVDSFLSTKRAGENPVQTIGLLS
jgi:hypothetical protein